MLGRGGDDDPALVLGAKGPARPARVLDAPALAYHALAAVERRAVLEDAEGGFVERGVDPLPLTGGIAVAERGHHAEGREEAGHVVGIDRRGPGRRPVRRTVE